MLMSPGVRPVLRLDLSSLAWTKGEEIASADKGGVVTKLYGGDFAADNRSKEDNNSNSSLGNYDSNNDSSSDTTDSGNKDGISDNKREGGENINDTVGKGTTANNAHSVSNDDERVVITAPSRVKSLKVTNKKKNKIVLSFKKVKNADGYQIQYAKNKKFTKGKNRDAGSNLIKFDFLVEKADERVYYIGYKLAFKVQIIVLKEVPFERCPWLSALSRDLNVEKLIIHNS